MMYNNIFSIFLIIFILFESVFYLKHYFHFLRRFIFLYIFIFCTILYLFIERCIFDGESKKKNCELDNNKITNMWKDHMTS